MNLLVWKESLEEALLREGLLAGSAARAAWPERAPVRPGVALCDGATRAADVPASRAGSVGAACARAASAPSRAAPAAAAGDSASASAATGASDDATGRASRPVEAAVRDFARARAGFAAAFAAGARGAT
ncbi:hypothetical protein WJ542_06955 [Paraburkholderia sp. B3]|uniref:hypothetical protein n=1 Tax=Paraburkholderia sp. B3 TaxID=3134791 RepID=UPI003981C591